MKAKDIIKLFSIAAKYIGTPSMRSGVEGRTQHSQDMDQQFQDAGLRAGPPPKSTSKGKGHEVENYWKGYARTKTGK